MTFLRNWAPLLDMSHDVIVLFDGDGTVKFFNQAWTAMTGYDRTFGIGRSFSQFLQEPTAGFFTTWWQSLERAPGQQSSIDLVIRRSDNTVLATALQALQWQTPEGRALHGGILTEKIIPISGVEEDLKVVREDMDTFCYSVSHDLRAPLRAMDGFAKIVMEDWGEHISEEGHGYIQRIRSAAKRMERMIDGLLSLSNVARHPLLRKNLDLHTMAMGIAKGLPSFHAIQWQIAKPLTTYADQGLTEIILQNLFDNAVKFTANETTPKIEFFELPGQPSVYVVRDNGIGLNSAIASNVFQPFVRLHGDQYPGSGIGLSLVRRSVQRHGGQLWIENPSPKGVAFHFTLSNAVPRSHEPAQLLSS